MVSVDRNKRGRGTKRFAPGLEVLWKQKQRVCGTICALCEIQYMYAKRRLVTKSKLPRWEMRTCMGWKCDTLISNTRDAYAMRCGLTEVTNWNVHLQAAEISLQYVQNSFAVHLFVTLTFRPVILESSQYLRVNVPHELFEFSLLFALFPAIVFI